MVDDYDSTFGDRLDNIMDLSTSRIQKILEIGQYTILYFIMGMVAGVTLEYTFPRDNAITVKKRSLFYLIFYVSLQLVTLTIVIYYINKIVLLVPFLFKFTSYYVPGLKSEYSRGVIALTIVFISSQPSLITRIAEIKTRFIGSIVNAGIIDDPDYQSDSDMSDVSTDFDVDIGE